MKKIFSLFALVVILTGCAQQKPAPLQTQETKQSEQTTMLRVGKNLILVFDQKAGGTVHVNQVILEKNGFLAIHEDKNDSFGDIIGNSNLLTEGTSNNFDITLNKPTDEGLKYYAMLHADDGDGVFDAAKDLPLKDEQGNIMHGIFYADDTAQPGAISI